MNDFVLIREIAHEDAGTVALLSGELGYPVDVVTMRERINRALSSTTQNVYVACAAGAVVGWIDVSTAYHLASGGYGEIVGLVVSNGYRSQGIGRQLIAEAESWLGSRGITKVVVRSRISREAAHRFYLREGYTRTKTSAVFAKELWSRSDTMEQ